MNTTLQSFYEDAQKHRKMHQCGGVPYDQTNLLISMLLKVQAKNVLEIGTGIGYSAAVMATANPQLLIHTIDKDHAHVLLAKKYWKQLGVLDNITIFEGKAHMVMQDFTKPYDLIFFDGYTPQRKFIVDFDRLLKKNGVLLTANLFLNNTTGGKYLKELQNNKNWQTSIIEDTAISVKR